MATRNKTCCIFCGKDTWNKSRICKECLSGTDDETKSTGLLDNTVDEAGKRPDLYGFMIVDKSWPGFSNA